MRDVELRSENALKSSNVARQRFKTTLFSESVATDKFNPI